MTPLKKGDPVRVRLHTGEVVDAVYEQMYHEGEHEVSYKGKLYCATSKFHDKSCVRFVGNPCDLVPVGGECMSNQKQYADRDIMQLDEDGGYYFRHVNAMTGEGLHSKSDIAAELGHRDQLIDTYRELCGELVKALSNHIDQTRPIWESVDIIVKAEKVLGGE